MSVYNNTHGFVIPDEHIPSEADMERYANGDETITKPLIEGLVGYIVNSVDWFVRMAPTAKPYREDCQSEALLELNMYVLGHLGQQFTSSHFMNAAKLSCLGAVKKWLREMSVAVTLPATTGRRHNIILTKQKLTGTERRTDDDIVFDTVWFDTFLELLDSFDRKLVELKMAGLSDSAISGQVNIHQRHVKSHLKRIANFYLDGE